MYPVSDKVSNPFEIQIPVIFRLNSNYKNSLNPDFNQLRNYYPFSEKYLTKLKLAFGIKTLDGDFAAFGIKKKLEKLIATGKYKTIAELAKVTGYSDSYISRVLKYKK